MNSLDLADNGLTGMIPSQLGQLQGASVILEGNLFDNKTAPLSLCVLSSVEAFDLANDTSLCPPERNALNDIYDSAKGAEWTDRTNWLGGDEYTSYCDWKGVTCNEKNRVTELNLANNGLSGRLSESIGNLTFIEVLDLSDNDIKVMTISAQFVIIAFVFVANYLTQNNDALLVLNLPHRDRFQQRLATLPISLICV